MREPVVVLGVQADPLEQVLNALLAIRGAPEVVDLERLGHDLADPHARVQRRHRILEDHHQVAPDLAQSLALQPRDVLALNSTEPSVTSSSRTMQRASVDLPQPDSPTMPSVSPCRTSNETPSTACTLPISAGR